MMQDASNMKELIKKSSFLNKLKDLTSKMNVKNVLMIFLAIVLIIVIYYIYTKYFSKGFGKTIENHSNQKCSIGNQFGPDWY